MTSRQRWMAAMVALVIVGVPFTFAVYDVTRDDGLVRLSAITCYDGERISYQGTVRGIPVGPHYGGPWRFVEHPSGIERVTGHRCEVGPSGLFRVEDGS